VSPGTPIGIGTSIVLITAGAILKYAITEGNIFFLDIQAAGTILLIIGILALVLAIAYTIMVSSRSRPAYEDRGDIARDREYREEPTRRRDRY